MEKAHAQTEEEAVARLLEKLEGGSSMALDDLLYFYKAKLERVIDGDTIIAMVDMGFNTWKKVNIRLFGINTPEVRTRDLEEKQRGLLAKQFVVDRLDEKDGKFYLESRGVGKYGRCIGIIHIADDRAHETLNEQLLSEGHAEEYMG